jgi:hypothetical protein
MAAGERIAGLGIEARIATGGAVPLQELGAFLSRFRTIFL